MFLQFALAASLASCPVENARYDLRGSTGVAARFYPVPRSRDWPTGLALRVRVAESGRSYWFLPWEGGTNGKTNLAWVRERRSPIQYQTDRRDIEFFAMDAAYNLDPGLPRAGGLAPAHMLLPDLSNLAWHSTTAINRDSIARAFFDLAGCEAPQSTDLAPRIEFPPVP